MRRCVVLFVDDDVLDCGLMESTVRRLCEEMDCGIQREFVNTGAEALERLARRRYDAVLVDWRLPDMSGADVIDAVHDGVPVGVFTDYDPLDVAQQCPASVLRVLQKSTGSFELAFRILLNDLLDAMGEPVKALDPEGPLTLLRESQRPGGES